MYEEKTVFYVCLSKDLQMCSGGPGINSSDRFTKHRKFKSVLEPENTLKAPDKCFRDALFNFLLKISDINVHTN